MFVALGNLSWTLMLLSGVCSQWNVDYHQQHICAVNGSSVVVPCSFSYPKGQKVSRVMWSHNNDMYDGPFIYDSSGPNTHSRLEYFGNMQRNCSFKIHHVEHNDAGEYFFRFVTDKNKYSGAGGSTIKVVDLNVSVTKPNEDGTIKEGDSVTLTCVNGCDGDRLSSALSWFKDGEPINEGPVLYLSNMSSTNSGNYTCSLKTSTGTTSEAINIDVEYGPKNTSVSVEPSMEIDAGSISTLICCSHANPPVENYIWFKIDENGNIMDVGHQPVIFSGDGGQYFCRATNKHGSQNSTVVTIEFRYWATFKGYIILILTVAVILIVIIVIAIRSFNKKKETALENYHDEETQDTEYANCPASYNNQSQERSQCEEAAEELIYATVNIHTKGKSNMGPQTASQSDDDHVIYSTVQAQTVELFIY